jgi:hypothetical protein
MEPHQTELLRADVVAIDLFMRLMRWSNMQREHRPAPATLRSTLTVIRNSSTRAARWPFKARVVV